MFSIVDKAHNSRKMLALVWKRLKQNSKPKYLLALALSLLRCYTGYHSKYLKLLVFYKVKPQWQVKAASFAVELSLPK